MIDFTQNRWRLRGEIGSDRWKKVRRVVKTKIRMRAKWVQKIRECIMTSYHLLLVFILKKFSPFFLPTFLILPLPKPAYPFWMLVQSVSNLLLLLLMLFLRDTITTTGGISTNRLASFFLSLSLPSHILLSFLCTFLQEGNWCCWWWGVMKKKLE